MGGSDKRMAIDLKKSVYIPSIEASDIYCHMFRNKDLKLEYIGMIPSSLELNKLISIGFKTHKAKTSDRILSDDIINLKFKQKVKSKEELLKDIDRKINEQRTNKENTNCPKIIEYKDKLIGFKSVLEKETDDGIWNEVSNEDLRKYLYINGFLFNGHKYVVYKRSSSKSRVGQCLFIKESFYDEMIKWSRMDLPFEVAKIDYPSLLAYESLVGSSLESLIRIDPKNILIVNDVESRFKQICNVVRTGENGYLDSFEEETEISNSLFDGESLLDSSYFKDGKSMKLLRNHMFKTAAFNCNVQLFLRNQCPKEICYEYWKVKNMFGQEMLAKDVHLIITPSSLKALKFSHVLGTELDMWEYWKKIVSKDSHIFGVCKSEKQSKHGSDENGNTLQQMSYQMINSLPINKDDVYELTSYERDYVEKLKNNDDFFIKHIKKNINVINSNEMFTYLFERNRDIVHTKLFRKYRADEISGHIKKVKKGKVRIHKSDYLVMLGNPVEFLQHAVGKLNLLMPKLKRNEVYTTLFDFGEELIGFRNPHTSPSNVLIVANTYNKDITTYFNLTDNIVCVNAIEFPLQDILSGCDYDSDTILISNNENLLSYGKRVFGNYRVCINEVASSKKQYQLSKKDMAEIDNQLSKSQRQIGEVVNLGQLCMSTYWDSLTSGKLEIQQRELLKKIDVMTVLSGICIDLAKKMFDINIKSEIDFVKKTKQLRTDKPLFWIYVSKNKDVKTTKYNCPMDCLDDIMSNLKNAIHRKNINLKELLVKGKIKDGDRKQIEKITKYVEEMCKKINAVYAGSLEKEEKEVFVDSVVNYYRFYIEKLKISPSTMCAILLKISDHKNDKIAIRMMSILHKTNPEKFINTFKIKNSTLL